MTKKFVLLMFSIFSLSAGRVQAASWGCLCGYHVSSEKEGGGVAISYHEDYVLGDSENEARVTCRNLSIPDLVISEQTVRSCEEGLFPEN